MKILTSQKGKPQLALDGYLYIIDKNDKKIYWKCVRNLKGRTVEYRVEETSSPWWRISVQKSTKALSREKRLYGVPGAIGP